MRQLTRKTGEFRAESRCSLTLVHETGKTKGEKRRGWEAERGEKNREKVGFELASHLEGRFRVTTLREERAKSR